MKRITDKIYYVGVNDHQVDLFENQYKVPNGMAYNSYVLVDEKVAIMDTVDIHFFDEWMASIKEVLKDRKPDYLIVQHMEPDHSANVMNFLKVYPDTVVVGNSKTFKMLEQFFNFDFPHRLVVNELDSLSLGSLNLTFVFAPMVHWPEVMVTYESSTKTLFSADGFGKFGALDVDEPWDDEARRYFIGIVGKYGPQVQALLKKAATLDISRICPLHGPVLETNLAHYIKLYDTWTKYEAEEEGIVLVYTSVYGHTKEAVLKLEKLLKEKHAPKVEVIDLARSDMAYAVSEAFKFNKIVLATTTYNASIFPFMHDFLVRLVEHNFQNKIIGLIENGTWAPMAAKVMKDLLAPCKNLTFLNPVVRINSAINGENEKQLEELAVALTNEYEATVVKEVTHDPKSLFNIGYGLYVVTSHDGKKHNGCIVNTVAQINSEPLRVSVSINKANYSHEIIKKTGILNVNCLQVGTPFSVFEQFGFVSGRDHDKFAGESIFTSANGLAFLPKYANAFISLKVEDYIDMGSHGLFICSVTESRVISDRETMTYTYYQKNVKPKPDAQKKGWVCKVCGYVHEGDLPEDFICPLCKHGAADFEEIK